MRIKIASILHPLAIPTNNPLHAIATSETGSEQPLTIQIIGEKSAVTDEL